MVSCNREYLVNSLQREHQTFTIRLSASDSISNELPYYATTSMTSEINNNSYGALYQVIQQLQEHRY